MDKPHPILQFVFPLFLGIVAGGAIVHWADSRHRIRWSEQTGHVSIDGHDIPALEPCWRGCRTEGDETCEKFRHLLRSE